MRGPVINSLSDRQMNAPGSPIVAKVSGRVSLLSKIENDTYGAENDACSKLMLEKTDNLVLGSRDEKPGALRAPWELIHSITRNSSLARMRLLVSRLLRKVVERSKQCTLLQIFIETRKSPPPS